MKIGGCQIPVTRDIKKNADEIKKAIDWAASQGVDMLLTPECSLSGYVWAALAPTDPDVITLARELGSVVKYAKEKGVDIASGTSGGGMCKTGPAWYNQLKFYVDGELVHTHNKMMLTKDEPYYPGEELKTFVYKGIVCAGLICNDLWVCGYQRPGDAGKLAGLMAEQKVQLCFLAAYAPRIPHDPDYFYTWSDIHIQTYSRQAGYTIAVVDSATQQDGSEYNNKTGTPSGIFEGGPEGRGWLVKTDPSGTQYYSYELDIKAYE